MMFSTIASKQLNYVFRIYRSLTRLGSTTKNISLGVVSQLLLSFNLIAVTDIQLYIGCEDANQNNGSKIFRSSDYYFDESNMREVCLSTYDFVDSQDIQKISQLDGISKELSKEFKKDFEFLKSLDKVPYDNSWMEKVIKLPNTASQNTRIEQTIQQDLLIELTDTGQKHLGEMTKKSSNIYLVIDTLIVTDFVIIRPIDNGKIRLSLFEPSIYKKIIGKEKQGRK